MKPKLFLSNGAIITFFGGSRLSEQIDVLVVNMILFIQCNQIRQNFAAIYSVICGILSKILFTLGKYFQSLFTIENFLRICAIFFKPSGLTEPV